MRRLTASLFLFVALAISGCATGPKYSELAATLPVIETDKGRIYFYRSGSPFGAALQPAIMLNSMKVGSAVPGGVFFKDVAPGNYEVSTETEVERTATFTLGSGETRYVKFTIGLGFFVGRVYPNLVAPSEGEQEIQKLSYIGD